MSVGATARCTISLTSLSPPTPIDVRSSVLSVTLDCSKNPRGLSPPNMISKSFIHIFTSLSTVLVVQAVPLSTPNIGSHLYPRANPCEPGGTPILYQDYYGDMCPPKNSMNSDGSCPTPADQNCVAYCEVRQSFSYDQEKPVVNNPYCHGPLTCTVTDSKTFTYTYSGSVNAAWTKAFTLGVTGGFSYASATTNLQSTSVNLKAGECGYFTFLPELHNSW